MSVGGVTLGSHIFYAYRYPPESLRQHELVHVAQYKKFGIPLFLCIYVIEYIWYRMLGYSHDKAYRSISFEREAFGKEN
jgi:hypothetical protein